MNRLILTLIFTAFTVCCSFAQPKADFDKKRHDFGAVLWKNPVTATFKITNGGDKPLVISHVSTSCGCTDANWTQAPIAPGMSGEISTTYDAKTLGSFHQSIGIYCNAEPRPVYLSIKGKVTADPKNVLVLPYQIGAIKLDKDFIEFEDANKGDKPSVEILVANTSDTLYKPVLMHLPPFLSAEAVPEKLGEGEYGKIIVTLDTEQLPKLGLTQSTVYLSRFLGDKVGEENAIPVSAVLLPDFSQLTEQQRMNLPSVSLSETEIDLGALAGNEKKSKNIVIRNNGKSNLEISDLQVFNAALGVHLKKRVLKPGASTKLKITAYGQQLGKLKRDPKVMMITNDPASPKIVIDVKVTSK